MRNRVISGFLQALSLSLLVAAGAMGVAEAAISVPPNPDVWCGFYTVNSNLYCGGVCPFAGDVCTLTVLREDGVWVGSCNCAASPIAPDQEL